MSLFDVELLLGQHYQQADDNFNRRGLCHLILFCVQALDSLFSLMLVAEPEGELGGAELPLETVELPLENFFSICTIKFSSLNTFKANTRS